MPGADMPEEPSPSNEPGTPDLTVSAASGNEPAPEESTPEKPVQSIFSARSGIQDLLVKPPPASASAEFPEAPAADMSTESPKTGNGAKTIPFPERKTLRPAEPEPEPDAEKAQKLLKSKRQQARVRRRQKNYLEQRREQKKLRVFYSRIRLVFKLCFAVLWGILLYELVQSPVWLYNAPNFRVKEQHLLHSQQLAPLITPWVGKPLYEVDTGQLAAQIEERFAIVDRAVVRRKLFPARLEITLHEKRPWAEIYPDEKLAKPYGLFVPGEIIDLAPYRYDGSQSANRQEKIIVAPHTKLSKAFLRQLRELAWQARQVPGLTLVSLDVRNPQLVVLQFQETRVILGRPDHGASERLARLIPLAPKIKELQADITAVDLRWAEQVTFHQKPDQKIKPEPDEAPVSDAH